MTNLKLVDIDPRGEPVIDPRDRIKVEPAHQRSVADQSRGTYTENDPPANGNRRRDHDADNHGACGNDLTDGRNGQDWKGW